MISAGKVDLNVRARDVAGKYTEYVERHKGRWVHVRGDWNEAKVKARAKQLGATMKLYRPYWLKAKDRFQKTMKMLKPIVARGMKLNPKKRKIVLLYLTALYAAPLERARDMAKIASLKGMSPYQARRLYRAVRKLAPWQKAPGKFNIFIDNAKKSAKVTSPEYIEEIKRMLAVLESSVGVVKKPGAIVPQVLTDFMKHGTPAFQTILSKLYQQLMQRKPSGITPPPDMDKMRLGMSEKAVKYRDDIARDLIADVKHMLGIAKADKPAKFKSKLNDAAAMRLTRNLGHAVEVGGTAKTVMTILKMGPPRSKFPRGRRGDRLFERAMKKWEKDNAADIKAGKVHKGSEKFRGKTYRIYHPVTTKRKVNVILKEIPASHDLFTKFGTTFDDANQVNTLLYDGHYLRLWDQKGKKHGDKKVQTAVLTDAADVLFKNLRAFFRTKTAKGLEVGDLRVVDIATKAKSLGGKSNVTAIKLFKFGLNAESILPKRIRKWINTNKHIKDKELAKLVMARIMRSVYAKDPSVRKSKKKKDDVAKQIISDLDPKIKANAAKGTKAEHKHPITGRPSGAMVINSHIVSDVKGATPTVTLRKAPPQIYHRNFWRHGGVATATGDAIKFLYVPVFDWATRNLRAKFANDPKLKAAIARRMANVGNYLLTMYGRIRGAKIPTKSITITPIMKGGKVVDYKIKFKVIPPKDLIKEVERLKIIIIKVKEQLKQCRNPKDCKALKARLKILVKQAKKKGCDISDIIGGSGPEGARKLAKNLTGYVAFSGRVGVVHSTGGTLQKDETKVGGYVYSETEVDYALKNRKTHILVKGSVLIVGDPEVPESNVPRMPRGEELYGGATIARINTVTVGVSHKINKKLTLRADAGVLTTRGLQTGMLFDQFNYRYELLPSFASKALGGALTLTFNSKGGADKKGGTTVTAKAAAGGQFSITLNKTPKMGRERVVGGASVVHNFGKGTVGAAASVDYTGPAKVAVPRSDGGETTFDAHKGGIMVPIEVAAMFSLTKAVKLGLGLQYMWRKMLKNYQPAIGNEEHLVTGTVGARIKHKKWRGAASVNVSNSTRYTDMSLNPAAFGGAGDGTHPNNRLFVSADLFAGYSFKIKKFGLLLGPWLHVIANPTPENGLKPPVSVGAGLHAEGRF